MRYTGQAGERGDSADRVMREIRKSHAYNSRRLPLRKHFLCC